MSGRPKRAATQSDPGVHLPSLARAFADRARAPKAPLSRSQALSAAPWDKSMPPAWESAFRAAYADRLEELGVSLPAKPSGASGPSQGDDDRAARGIGRLTLRPSQKAIDKFTAEAKRIGCSRVALFESMVAGIKR